MNSKFRQLHSGNPLISPSILSADFGKLADEIQSVEKAGVDAIHIDVMDGQFVPNLTFGPVIVKAIRKLTQLPLTCHLMVAQPEVWLSRFADAGADLLTVHCEATHRLYGVIQEIKSMGCQAGVALSPATPVDMVEEVLDIVDLVLVMSVEPGFGGQEFIPSSLRKIESLSKMRAAKPVLIGVDGGVTAANIGSLRGVGADLFVAGSAIFSAVDRSMAVKELRMNLRENPSPG